MEGRILLVGCGHMGKALLSRWCGEGWRVEGIEVDEGRRRECERMGARMYEDVGAFRRGCDGGCDGGCDEGEVRVVVYCVRPQVSGEEVVKYGFFGKDVVHVSVMAGVGLERMGEMLGGESILVRVMPNTPVLVGRGTMVSVGNGKVGKGERECVDSLLGVCGENVWVEEESVMDAVTAVSGSGSAYVFYYLEVMGKLGESLGLEKDLSEYLALGVVEGAVAMARERRDEGESVRELKEGVISKGGTTEAAFRHLNEEGCGLEDVLTRAVVAARDRAREMG